MQHCTARKCTRASILFYLCCWYRFLCVCTTESSEGSRNISRKLEADYWAVTLYSWTDLKTYRSFCIQNVSVDFAVQN